MDEFNTNGDNRSLPEITNSYVVPRDIYNECMNDVDKDVSFVFTHSHRLRCFLDKLLNVSTLNVYDTELRFKNNSVLLLRLYPNKESHEEESYQSNANNFKHKVNFKLDLLVNGTDDIDDKKGQWVISDYAKRERDRVFGFRDGDTSLNESISKIQYIFLIRHGQATHNLYGGLTGLTFKKAWKKITKPFKSLANRNTQLVNTDVYTRDPNVISIKKSGIEVKNLLVVLNVKNVVSVFVSDLIRTHQTCQQFLTGFLHGYGNVNIPNVFYVLPCSHEVTYKDGNCDGDQFWSGMSGENISTCNPDVYKDKQLIPRESTCNDINIRGKLYKLNWNKYAEHYPHGIRGTLGSRDDSKKCRNNSLLNLLLEINLEINSNYSFLTKNNRESIDSNRTTIMASHADPIDFTGGRSHRKSRRKSIRKKRKSIRKRKYNNLNIKNG